MYRVGVEVAFEPGLGGCHRGQRRGVDDLVRRLPGVREVAHEVRLRGQGGVGFPDGHRVVHAPPVEVRARGPHEVGDEREHVVVRRGPVECAAFVLGTAVEGHVRRVDQLGHCRSFVAADASRRPCCPTVAGLREVDGQAERDGEGGDWWSTRTGTRGGVPVLSASGISQRFGDKVVLDDVDLEIPSGRVVGLLGPNGAGKTTLMRVLFGVIEPDSGSVTWHGRAATPQTGGRGGICPKNGACTAICGSSISSCGLPGSTASTKRRAGRGRCGLLDQLGLGARARDDVKDLSGGMAQRVQLAAAMVHEPDVLVLDEPFAGLDPAAIQFLSDVVSEHVRVGPQPAFLEPSARPGRRPLRHDHAHPPWSCRPRRRGA